MAGLIAATELTDALGPVTFMAIFDDANIGVLATVQASSPVLQVLALSFAEVASYMPAIYDAQPAELPSTTSQLLKEAQLQFAIALSYRRHPEYVKTYGAGAEGTLWKEASAKMARIQKGTQRIAPGDAPPAAQPGNVGGISFADGSRIATTNTDGTKNNGDF